VVGLLLTAAFLSYFDRLIVSVLKTTLKTEFRIDDAGYALLINVFTGCYAVAYLISGWLTDRIGPRRALTLFVGVWSMVGALCGIAKNFFQLAVLRALLGLFEPGFQPVSIRSGTVWAPPARKGLFLSMCGAGSLFGAIAAPPLVTYIALHYHWRLAFILPGIVGVALATVWWFTYRDPDAQDLPANVPGKGAAPPVPALSWGELWRHQGVWGIMLSRFFNEPVWAFCLFWLPGYLHESKGATFAQVGLLGWLPFVVGNLGGLGLSAISDAVANRGRERVHSRKLVMYVASAFGLLCIFIPGASLTGTLVLFCAITLLCISWLFMTTSLIAEVFPIGNVASIWGMAGAVGSVGAIIFNYLLGHAAHLVGLPTLVLIMGCFHPCAALILRLMVHPLRPVVKAPLLAHEPANV